MSQTLVIRTPDAVSTTSKTFPKQGMFNLKITRNGEFDTVELWFRSATSNITLELAGASFQSTATVSRPKDKPQNPMDINGSSLVLTPNATHYLKIKLDKDITDAYLRCSYAAKSTGSTVCGGNISGQAFVDYSKKPYISTSMEGMFRTNHVRHDITKWDMTSVTDFTDMFVLNATFNQPIGNWDVSNATTMHAMFFLTNSFNQHIGDWNVSKVTSMKQMFDKTLSFNSPIGNWNVSNVTNMHAMFRGASSFNQPIGNWDISKVTSMMSMFENATSFNQDLSSWPAKFNVNVNLSSFFAYTVWGTTNYDNFLNAFWTDINTTRPQAWALRTISKVLNMGTSKYSEASAAARGFLVSNGWTITDGGLAE